MNDGATLDAEGGLEPRAGGQDPRQPGPADDAHRPGRKGASKVIAVIDTGVDTLQAFTGALAGTPALTPQKVAALSSPAGEGKTGVYISQKFALRLRLCGQ